MFFKDWLNDFESIIILLCWMVIALEVFIPVKILRAIRPFLRAGRLLRMLNCKKVWRALTNAVTMTINSKVRQAFKMLTGKALIYPDDNLCFDVLQGRLLTYA